MLKRRISGGFVCNTGRAVAKLGLESTFLGLFGDDQVEPLFDEFDGLATLVTLAAPLNIQLLEFLDGKIMMPNTENLSHLNWKNVQTKIGQEKLAQMLNVDIVGLGYWSNLYDFETILEGMVDICLANGKTKRMFHDFANLNKRDRGSLTAALEKLTVENARIPQTLSLNEHEGGILAAHFGLPYPEDVNNPASCDQVFDTVCKLRGILNIDELIVHTSYYAVIATATQGDAAVAQNYCPNPVKTTGAGDTFNGGYMVAAMADLSVAERLTMANATTFHYVSTGTPPTREELIGHLAN